MVSQVLEMRQLGLSVRFLRTGADTNGEVLEMEVTGQPRGFLTQSHVHDTQDERLEVVSGTMKLRMDGREHVLTAGQSIEVPAATPHTQLPVGDGVGVVRIEVHPAGRTQPFLERLAELCREGKITAPGLSAPGGRRRTRARVLRHRPRSEAVATGAADGRRACDGRRAPDGAVRVRRRVGRGGTAGAVFDALADTRTTRNGGSRSTSTCRRTGHRRWASSRASTSRAGCPTT